MSENQGEEAPEGLSVQDKIKAFEKNKDKPHSNAPPNIPPKIPPKPKHHQPPTSPPPHNDPPQTIEEQV